MSKKRGKPAAPCATTTSESCPPETPVWYRKLRQDVPIAVQLSMLALAVVDLMILLLALYVLKHLC